MFDGLRDPYDRIEELEVMVTSQGLALEEAASQLKDHSDNFVQVSNAMIQLADAYKDLQRQNHSLRKQLGYLQIWIEKLENKDSNEK